ncbi:MAG: helix-turn-helix transcriptional regulator [Eubacteriales bacterium]|nr:helix-turn-helix transcriptional regulator [Eubacteriales bacterium]
MTFAERLHSIRLARGLKQKEVAAAIGISESNCSMYEHGTREPGLSKLVDLARVLDVSTDYLLGISPNNSKISKCAATFSHFSEKELEQLCIVFSEAFPIPPSLLLQILLLYVNQTKTVRCDVVDHLLKTNAANDPLMPSILPQPDLTRIQCALDLFRSYHASLSEDGT